MTLIERTSQRLGPALSALAALRRDVLRVQESPHANRLEKRGFFDDQVDAINEHHGLAARFQAIEDSSLADHSSRLRLIDQADAEPRLRIALAVYAYAEGDFRRARSVLPAAAQTPPASAYSRALLGQLKALAACSGDDVIVQRDQIKRQIDRDIAVLLHPLRVELCRELADDIKWTTFDLTLITTLLHDRLHVIEAILKDFSMKEEGE
jgi:hypothetical protein